VDDEGSPVPSARISAVRARVSLDPAVLARFSTEAEADAGGGFVLEPLDEAVYEVEVRAPGFAPHRLLLDAASRDSFEVRLRRPER
jgi:hypothetical protein